MKLFIPRFPLSRSTVLGLALAGSGFVASVLAGSNVPTPPPATPPKPCGECEEASKLPAAPACEEKASLTWAMKVGYGKPVYPGDLAEATKSQNTRGTWMPSMAKRASPTAGGGGGGSVAGKFGGGSISSSQWDRSAAEDEFDQFLGAYLNRGPLNRDPIMLEIDAPYISGLNRGSIRINSSAAHWVISSPLPADTTLPAGPPIQPRLSDANGNEVSAFYANLLAMAGQAVPARQVITETAFADIRDRIDGGFEVRLWRNEVPHPYTGGGNSVLPLPAGPPVQEVIFKFVSRAPADPATELWVITRERFGISGEYLKTDRYVETMNGQSLGSLVVTTHQGEGINGPILKKEIISHARTGPKLWDYDAEREVFEASTAADGSPGTLTKIAHSKEVYRDFSPAEYFRRTGVITVPLLGLPQASGPVLPGDPIPFGPYDGPGGKDGYKRLMSKIEDFGGRNLTTTYTYADAQNENQGRLESVVYPDGSWKRYQRVVGNNSPISAISMFASWKDVSLANYKNGVATWTFIEKENLTRETSIQGVAIARSRANRRQEKNGEDVFTLERFDGSNWLKEVYTFFPESGPNAGRPLSVLHQDGTLTTYTYLQYDPVVPATHFLAPGELMVTERTGASAPDGKSVASGMETRTIYNISLQRVSEETYRVNGPSEPLLLVASETADLAYGLDALGRPVKWIFNGNPADYRIEQRNCCGLEFERNRDGSTTEYFYDALKRRIRTVSKASSTAVPVTIHAYHNQPATGGFRNRTTRSAGGTTLFVSETTRDLAGEVIERKEPDANGDGVVETHLAATVYSGAGGTIRSVTYPDGGTQVTTTYRDGQVKSVTGTAVPDVTFDYGAHNESGGGLWVKRTQANGTEWTKVLNDLLGRELKIEFPDGAGATYLYASGAAGSIGKRTSSTDPDGVALSFSYDAEGRATTVTEAMPGGQQRITRTQTDALNDPTLGSAWRNRTWVNDVLVKTEFEGADGYGSRTESLGTISGWQKTLPVDGSWTTTSTTPANQRLVKTYTEGRLAKSELYDNQNQSVSWTSWTYDPFERPHNETDSRTGTKIYDSYTESGNLLSLSVLSATANSGYDTTTYSYDVMGRQTAVDQPDTLDADGNVIENITRTAYHPSGEIAAVWGDQTNPTWRGYDEQNRLTELRTWRTLAHNTQPTAATAGYDPTTWTYHPQRGWLSAKRDAVNKGADYTHTAAGRLATRQWARVVSGSTRLTTSYSYDAGKLVATTYNDNLTPNVGYSYDAFGRQTLVTQNGNQWAYAYDPATLQLDAETITYDTDGDGTGDLSRTLDRSHDNLLRNTGYQLKNGNTVEADASYTYDSAGRLATVSGGGDSFSYGYQPNSYDLVRSVTGPVHSVTNTWDPLRDVLVTKENKVGSSVISRYDYTVNELGQRTALATSGSAFPAAQNLSWGYNVRGEVTSAAHSDPVQSRFYVYDAIGNRKSAWEETSAGPGDIHKMTEYTANNLNQYGLLAFYVSEEKVAFVTDVHDADGNHLQGRLPLDKTRGIAYQWDGENRLIEAKRRSPDVVVGTYRYDPFGRRISKQATINSQPSTTYFIYDGWNLVSEHNNGVLTKSHLWGKDLSGSLQGAGGVGGLLSSVSHQLSAKNYPLYDGNGNVGQYLDAAGAIAARFEYDPFGKLTVNTDTADQFAFRFSTKYQDVVTGLYYYGYRYYDLGQGRWLNRDPLGERGGRNLNAILANNCINNLDIWGMQPALSPSYGPAGNVVQGPWRPLPSTGTAGGNVGPVVTPGENPLGTKTGDGGTVVGLTPDGRPGLIEYPPERMESLLNTQAFNETAFDEVNQEWVDNAKDLAERKRREEKITRCSAARANQKAAERNGVKKGDLNSGPQTREAWCCKAEQYLNRLGAINDARQQWKDLNCDELPGSKKHDKDADKSESNYNSFKELYNKRCAQK